MKVRNVTAAWIERLALPAPCELLVVERRINVVVPALQILRTHNHLHLLDRHSYNTYSIHHQAYTIRRTITETGIVVNCVADRKIALTFSPRRRRQPSTPRLLHKPTPSRSV